MKELVKKNNSSEDILLNRYWHEKWKGETTHESYSSLQQEVMLMTKPFSQAQKLLQWMKTSLVSALVLDRLDMV